MLYISFDVHFKFKITTRHRCCFSYCTCIGTNVVSSIVKIERSESSLARNEATLSPPNKYLQNERIVSLPSIAKTEGPKSFGARFAATLSSPNNAEGPESSLARNAATLSSPNNALQKNLLVTLKSSSDPAKLVLDSMQGSLTYYWRNGDVSSKEKVVSGNITLLKILMGLSTHVGPHLKENATNLASQWKEKLRGDTENSLESLGYLFIAMYGLLGTLHEDEIVMLLRRVSQHKRSLELCQTHGFADYVPDFIQKLIERKLLMVAVRSIYAFKLFDKLPPVPLLKEHVDDVMMCSEVIYRSQIIPDEKDKALDGKIADLRAAIQCIKDYNLESEYPSKTVELQIVQLDEMRKAKWRSLEPSLVPKVEQEERKRKKPCSSSSASKLQPGKVLKIKFVFSGSRP